MIGETMDKRQAFKELRDEFCKGLEYKGYRKSNKGFILFTRDISIKFHRICEGKPDLKKIARAMAVAVFNQYPECYWFQIDVERLKASVGRMVYDYSIVAEYRGGKIFIKFFHGAHNIDPEWSNSNTYSKAFLDERERAREKYGSRKCGIGRRQFKSALDAFTEYVANEAIRSFKRQIRAIKQKKKVLEDSMP